MFQFVIFKKAKQDLQPQKEVASCVVSVPLRGMRPAKREILSELWLHKCFVLLRNYQPSVFFVLFTRQMTTGTKLRAPSRGPTEALTWTRYGMASLVRPKHCVPSAVLIQPHRATENLQIGMAGNP